jgi:LuxR family transcriptional regulator, maltose regulon positive regulatory protein
MNRNPLLNLAKVAAPVPADVVARPRLYVILDAALERQITWVSGPAGCGKTTLVADFVRTRARPCLWYQVDAGDGDAASLFHFLGLAAKRAAPRSRRPLLRFGPEYLPGIQVFARRFFRDLFSRLTPGSVVVFDNVQDVPAETPLFELLREGFAELPPGVNAVLLSRADPTPMFSRFRAERTLTMVGWEELRFTDEEATELLGRLEPMTRDDDQVGGILATARGWAAGLVLMAGGNAKSEGVPASPTAGAANAVFDYFATEVFRTLDPSRRRFLLKTAVLPSATPKAAEDLTGDPRASEFLKDLARRNFFTVRRPRGDLYEYHPLFRSFLRQRAAETYGGNELDALKRSAAALLEDSGQISEAVALIHELEDWDTLAALVARQAPLLIGQTRHQTVESWLAVVPESVLAEKPWLLYWLGASRALLKPAEAQAALDSAYRSFRSQSDAAGAYLAWATLVEIIADYNQYDAALDTWLDEFDDLVKAHPAYPSPEIECRVAISMLAGLEYRRPWHPDRETWGERALVLAERRGDIARQFQTCFNRLQSLSFFTASPTRSRVFGKLQALLRHPDLSEFNRLRGEFATTAFYKFIGRHEEAIRIGKEGMARLKREGILFFAPILLYMIGRTHQNIGDLDRGRKLAKEMRSYFDVAGPTARFYHQALTSFDAYFRGEFARATDAASGALDMIGEHGVTWAHLVLGFVLVHSDSETGRSAEASARLATLLDFCERCRNVLMMHHCRLCEAEIALNDGHDREALALLREALVLGREVEISYVVGWRPEALARLFGTALENDIEVETVQRIIRGRGLLPGPQWRHLESWPRRLKVHVLGDFAIFKDEERLAFPRKAPRKPLDLLKALIAHGGVGVGIDRLTRALWPDARGDAAGHAFDTTLHRLRRLLGVDGVLLLEERRLTLSPDLCWTDSLALQQLFVEANGALGRRGPAPTKDVIERIETAILGLYKGLFLDGLSDEPWATAARDALASRTARVIREIAGFWRQRRENERAALGNAMASAIESGETLPPAR